MSGSSNANGVLLDIGNGTPGRLGCEIGYSPYVYVTSPANNYDDGNWHLFVCVLNRTANTLNMYVDGQLVKSVNSAALGSSNLVSGASPTIGSLGNPYFDGSIDNLRVYNRALNVAEVQALYHLSD